MTASDPATAPAVAPHEAQALHAAAGRLHADYPRLGAQTIEQVLRASYERLAADASVSQFLPLLAERFTRQQLTALDKVDGVTLGDTPVVLFLCVHNAGRSQMAMGFLRHLAGDTVVAWSGGSEPGEKVNSAAVQATAERGIDIAAEFPKPWTEEIVRAADVVVTMGCGDACPPFPGKRYEDWQLDDPAGLDVEHVRPIRDDIEARVRNLLTGLGVTTTACPRPGPSHRPGGRRTSGG